MQNFAVLCDCANLPLTVRQSYSYCEILGDATINLAVSCKWCNYSLQVPRWGLYLIISSAMQKTCLAVINGVGNFKKNRSADEKNTNLQSFSLNNNSSDWMFMLTLSKVRNHPENEKLD